jgi:phytoene dehydrogenase-like protein
MAPFPYTLLEGHRDEQWRRRSPRYEQTKRDIAEHMLAFVEHYYPGFRALVEYAELATPLTFEQFSGGAKGAIYGYPATPERFRKSWLRTATPVKNLYLTGVDVASPGIMGALMGGAAAAGCVLGRLGFVSVLQAANVDLSELVFRSS